MSLVKKLPKQESPPTENQFCTMAEAVALLAPVIPGVEAKLRRRDRAGHCLKLPLATYQEQRGEGRVRGSQIYFYRRQVLDLRDIKLREIDAALKPPPAQHPGVLRPDYGAYIAELERNGYKRLARNLRGESRHRKRRQAVAQ